MGKISMPQGKGSQLHNRRDYEKIGKDFPDNIDKSMTDQNITIVDKDIRKVYREIFRAALQEYNQKQKRSDRKIEDYYEHISKSKNGEKLFYEDVMQWGKKEDFQSNPELRETAKECLKEYAESFEERNPNLKLIGAYIHMDEASPHLHIDYVPVAHGYSRGLKTRNSLDKAMKEMGYQPEKESRKNNATKLWKENEREYFGEICRSRGLEVDKERSYDRKSLSVEEYKEAKDRMLDDIEQEKGLLEQSIESNKKEIEEQKVKIASNSETLTRQANELKKLDDISRYLTIEGDRGINVEDYTISAKKSILGKIEAPERQGTFVEGMDKEQIKALMQRVKAGDELERLYNTVQTQCDTMLTEAKTQAKEILSEATAEKNETIAKTVEIINQRNSIIREAKKLAKKVEQKIKEVTETLAERLDRKKQLEDEIAKLEAHKGDLEPLRQEVEELTRAKQIMAGELDYELSRARFKDWDTMPFGSSYEYYRSKGELIALYNDGSIRKVGKNEHGGYDNKTLADLDDKLCRVGIMVDEECVRVPKSLLKELIDSKDRHKTLSKGLQNLIRQQDEVNKVVTKHRGQER